MNWNTIYITGNDDFWEDVNKKLSQSDLKFLLGHIEHRPDKKFYGLYWLDSSVTLREFKEAVGGKLVWKYRLRFFNELDQAEKPNEKRNANSFSKKEAALIKAMRKKSAVAA